MKTLSERIEKFKKVDIYPVISSEFTNGRPVLDILKSIADGGARIVQLREKNKTKREIYKLALKYREITSQYDMLFIMNDHLDIAMSTNADGVHLGQDDFPLEAARVLAPDLLTGCSTHNLDEAFEAIAAGTGYINIGPIYPTETKSVSCGALGLETLKDITSKVTVPFSVMGGIKEHHIDELIRSSACRIAMVTEITKAEDVTSKVKQLRSYWN